MIAIASYWRRLQQSERLLRVGTYGLMTFVGRGTNAILGTAYAAVLSAHDLGIYSLCAAILAAMALLSDGGMTQAVLRGYYDRHTDPKATADYLNGIVFVSRTLSLAVLLLVGVIGWFIWKPLTAGTVPLWPFFPLIMAGAYCDRATNLLLVICRAIEKPGAYALGGVAQAIGTLFFAGALVGVFKLGVVGATAALFAGSLTSTAVLSIILARTIALRMSLTSTSWKYLGEALSYGLPLVPNLAAQWGRQMAQRLVLVQVATVAQVGLFFLGNAIAMLALIGTQALELGYQPFYFKRRAEGAVDFREKVMKFARVLLALLAPIFVALILCTRELLHIFFRPAYSAVEPISAVLVAASFLQLQQPFMMKQLMFHKATRLMPVATVTPLLLALGLTPYAVNLYGLVGAAWLMWVANLLVLIGLLIIVRRTESPDHPLKTATILSGAVSLVALWDSVGAPLPIALNLAATKAFIFVVFTACCFGFWVWPNRRFLKQVLSR